MGTRLSQKTSLDENLSENDLLMVVDESDTTSSAEGTSKKVKNQYIIQSSILSLNSAQIILLHTTPQPLAGSPGAGFIIQPITITCIATPVSIQNTSSAYIYLSNEGNQIGNYLARQRDFFKNETAKRTYCFGAQQTAVSDGTYDNTIEDKGFYIYSNVAFNGDWTMKVVFTYQIVKL